jgi:hypothetical protein
MGFGGVMGVTKTKLYRGEMLNNKRSGQQIDEDAIAAKV